MAVSDDSLVRGVLLFLCAAGLGVWIVPSCSRLLAWLGAGKQIQAELPDSHQVKAGTPSMGGLIFVGITLALGLPLLAWRTERAAILLALLLAAMVLGMVDDLFSSARYKRGGLRARPKLAWQAAMAVLAVALMALGPGLPAQHIPGVGSLHSGWLIAPLGVLAIVATGHAVNLTDGLDGLAGGTTMIALGAFALIAFAQGDAPIGQLCLLVMGAVAGFLWFNLHPARLFMGDAGSLALGSLLGGVALATGQIVALIAIGVVFVMEALSVIIQVTYFKRTGGKRVFRMTPIHLHFQRGGWPETLIVGRFWLLGLAGALVGVSLALG